MADHIALEVRVREKRFPGREPLFRDLAFDLAEGEALALVGPSGVGKSTLLRMIAGIDPAFEGEIRVAGVPAAEAPAPGFVFQDPRLLPWLDAVANIRAVSPGTTEAEARALLSEMGLEGSEHALPDELSGGMQRRVALARALAVEPRLMILDEPFVSIDRRLARELQELIARLMDSYRPTLLLVTHDPEDAARLADRVIRLAGSPAAIVSDERIEAPRDRRDDETLRRITLGIAEGEDR